MAQIKGKRKRIQSSNNMQRKIDIRFDLNTLNMLCKFVSTDSTFIRRYDLIQLRRFLNIINLSGIEMLSPDMSKRLLYIQYCLEARLDMRLNNHDSILGYVSNKFSEDITFIDPNDLISKEDIDWVNRIVSETLKYKFIYEMIPQMNSLIDEFRDTSIGHRGDIVDKFEQFFKMQNNNFRAVQVLDSSNTNFSLSGESFENGLTDTFNKVKSPSRRLYTGMRGFNLITSGFENGRVYMIIGASGIGKSITLLNIAVQIKNNNKKYKTKDPTKKPCVVLLTMENSIIETITRLFDMVNEDGRHLHQYANINDAMAAMRANGRLVVSDENPIDIYIQYKPNKSVDTDYMYNLYDRLMDEGYEPIIFIQDHVKRIRSTDTEKDLRLELGDVINEFKVFATLKDIPVLTDSHLNRAGDKLLYQASISGKIDATKMVGKDNVGESSAMIENLDEAIVVNKEYDRDGTLYMVFSAIKIRDLVKEQYVLQPFAPGSTINLLEDVNMPQPLFKTSLRTQSQLISGGIQGIAQGTYTPDLNKFKAFNDDEPLETFDMEGYEDEIPSIPNIDVSDNKNLTSDIPTVEEDMWERAKRLGKICPLIKIIKNDEFAKLAI